MKTTDERVTELEIRFMEQQVLLDDLSDQIREQRTLIDHLRQDLSRVAEHIQPPESPNEKPPHY